MDAEKQYDFEDGSLLIFIGFVSLILKRFAKKSESYTNSEEFNEDIEEK